MPPRALLVPPVEISRWPGVAGALVLVVSLAIGATWYVVSLV